MRIPLLLLAALIAAACTGNINSSTGGGPGGGSGNGSGGAGGGVTSEDGGACIPQGRNDEVRLALVPACAGCHITGSKAFMASLGAFEAGLVYDTRYVKRGDPDNSLLYQMLRGDAPGTYPQMPPGETYDVLLGDGRATLTLNDVATWIRELPAQGVVAAEPVPARFTVRRLNAEEMIISLMDQLGLTLPDFVYTANANWQDNEYSVPAGRLFVWPKDWAPGINNGYTSDYRTIERYEALGGMAALDNRKKDIGLGPAAMQTLVQVSQAWCKRAIEKSGNTAVLRHVTLADTSAAKSTEIKNNIRYLYLRMLGDVPTAAQVDDVYQQVYLAYESQSTKAGWTAVCASFVRHPQWLSY